jgi:hypothetical protein
MRWICICAALAAGALLTTSPVRGAEEGPKDEEVLREAGVDTEGPALVEYLKKRTSSDDELAQINKLIGELGDRDFAKREHASTTLINLRRAAVPALRKALKGTDVEVAERAEDCLKQIESGEGSELDGAVIRLLAARRPDGAAEALLAFLPAAPTGLVVEEIDTALGTLVKKSEAGSRTIVRALADKHPERRAAAASALLRGDSAKYRADVRKLLEDHDLNTRMRVAVALAQAQEKAAVPVLIDLLGQLPADDLWSAEDLLRRLAGEKSPSVSLGDNDADRKRCRDAWAGWWAEQGDKVKLTRLTEDVLLGYTMVIELANNRILEVDAQKKVLWSIEELQYPLDAQLLPGGRVLVAEHHGNRVTERDRRGRVLWEIGLDSGPLMAQRLPNGNTFIATHTELMEFTPDKKSVFSYVRPNAERFSKALKLPNGEIAFSTDAQSYFRLDKNQKEIQSFPLEVSTFGGRLDVLPNGHVLVPQMRGNRVIEFDTKGKSVWEAAMDQPVAAVRLSNGHTLLTSLNQNRAVEVDQAGKEIWEYKSDTRVTRAWRR